jgi:hypothetical protein
MRKSSLLFYTHSLVLLMPFPKPASCGKFFPHFSLYCYYDSAQPFIINFLPLCNAQYNMQTNQPTSQLTGDHLKTFCSHKHYKFWRCRRMMIIWYPLASN